jgi:hypothetical protein
MRARVAHLDREIQATELYGDLSESHREEVADTLQQLKEERKDLLTSQERDIPTEGEMLKAAEEAAQAQRHAAQAALQDTLATHVAAVEEIWLREALALSEPVRAFLTQAKALDTAWRLLGVEDLRSCGSAHIRAAVLAALRG